MFGSLGAIGAGGATLRADKATYLASGAAGALIATLADPFGGGTTFSIVGSAPAALALASAGRIVRGNGATAIGQADTIVIRAAKGQRAIEEPLTFTAAATPTPTPTPAPTVSAFARNWARTNTPNLTAALSAFRAGTGRLRFAVAGHSCAAGFGAGTSNGVTDGVSRNGPAKLAAALRAAGYNVSLNNFFGTRISAANTSILTSFDPRLTAGGGAGFLTGTYLGLNLLSVSAAGHTWTFTTEACTQIELYTARYSGGGILSYSIDGGAAVQINTAGANAMIRTDVAGLPNVPHTVVFSYVSGGACGIGGAIGTAPGGWIEIVNVSATGSTSTQWNAASGLSPKNTLAVLDPDLAFLQIAKNDTAAATFEANVTTIANTWKSSGIDSILLGDAPSTTGNWNGTQADFIAKYKAISDALGVPMWSFWDYWGGAYANMQAAGAAYDTLHENETGYRIEWGEQLAPDFKMLIAA